MKKPGQPLSPRRGFTLLELILAMGIASLIILVIYQIFFLSLKETDKFKESINRHEEIYYALNYMEGEIVSSQEIWKVQRGGRTQYILVHFNPQAQRRKSHFVYYDLDDDGRLFRYGWYSTVQDREHFSFDNNPGKNKLAGGIEDFQIQTSDQAMTLKLRTKEGGDFEKTVARRWPIQES